ncbi:Fibrinogen-like protein 1 [Oryzias melastigma]|uniref:Fibrinogen-like protein 1 n=1 Tax=Oryzias melastigma TaxID=30732 RepID=A0A834FRZ9_ORYME|nr:fibrinogen-like protein 1 [Oryzias melastigma]KAF6739388.1 Fibrinogen-like protein 1 [Oryzias melastigma]
MAVVFRKAVGRCGVCCPTSRWRLDTHSHRDPTARTPQSELRSSVMEPLRTLLLFLLQLASPLAAPVPCEERVVRLEAEIRGLMNVINDQHRYILELHNTQSLQLQQIPNTHLGPKDLYRDCSEVFQDGNVASGLYVIRPDGSPTALSVFCDMNNGGGWTVFQRRRDGKESFDRAWVEYKHGFGDVHSPEGEFWLGNEPLHQLTSQGDYDLQIDMEDFKGNHRFAKYRNFRVDDEQDQYQLHVGEYTGTGDDALSDALNPNSPCSGGIKFSTFDHPNYINAGDDKGRCIRHSKSGWWFCRCDSGNLNGRYYKGPFEAMSDDGVTWYLWHGWSYAIKSVVMMLRAADLENPPPIIARWPGQFHTVAVTEGTNHAPYGQ